MHFIVSLTVSESKRLIAIGIASDHRVKNAMQTGRVVVVPGTTNGYVLEEMVRAWPDADWEQSIGTTFNKLAFVAGRTLPHGYQGPKIENSIPAVLIRGGEVTVMTSREAAEEMEPSVTRSVRLISVVVTVMSCCPESVSDDTASR